MSASVLEMRNIRKEFPGVVALADIDFDLREGEVHVLLGENGAGKSTLIKIISGAHQPDGGTIFFYGQPFEIRSPRQALQNGIATIYQELNLIPQMTVAENIFLGREPLTRIGLINRQKVTDMASSVLNRLGGEIDPGLRVSVLGIAQRQMVEIAKALSTNIKILILDEPTSALTRQEISCLFAMVRRLKKKGVAIIYISHRLAEIFEIGDRVTVLRDGRVIGTCPVNSVSVDELVQMMVNREMKDHFPKRQATIGAEAMRLAHFNRPDALHDVNLTIRKGEILGLTGLIGSGRTELARAIFGLDRLVGGQIFINGKLQKINSPRQAINLGIGFLTEDRKLQGLILKLSIEKNISLPSLGRLSRVGIIRKKAERRLTNQFIHELRIKAQRPDQPVQALSGGNQQKVVVSKWLGCDADVFIFDEPTRGIDVASKYEIYQLMNSVTERGAAVLMISSELPEILGMSDRILVMHQGRIQGEFYPTETTPEILLKCALGVMNET